MDLLEQINNDLKKAMKAGEKELVSTLRMLISALKYEQIEQKGKLSLEQAERILQKEVKQRKEAIELYKKGKRNDLAEKEARELDVIKKYLPEMMSPEEVKGKIKEILNKGEFASFGQAMGKVMGELKGKAEGSVVSKIMQEEFDKK